MPLTGPPVTSSSKSRPSFYWDLAARASVLLAVVTSAAMMCILALYSEPSADDFCRGRWFPITSSIRTWKAAPSLTAYVVDTYKYWAGRWLAIGIESYVMTAVDITSHYTVIILASWAVVIAGIYVLVRAVLAGVNGWRTAAACTAVVWVLYWTEMPSTGEGLYWFTGAVENLVSFAVGAVTIVLLARMDSVGARKPLLLTGALLGAVAVTGLHEVFGIALMAALALAILVMLPRGVKPLTPWIACLVVAGIGMAVSLVAPGNAVRASFGPPSRIDAALRIMSRQYPYHLSHWVFSVPFVATTIAFLLHPGIAAYRPSWLRYFTGSRAWLIPVTTLAVLYVGMLGPVYALTLNVPARTLNGLYLVFLTGWFLSLLVFSRGWTLRLGDTSVTRAVFSASLLLFSASVMLRGRTREAVWNLRYQARPWDAAVHARYATIRASDRSAPVVYLPRNPTPPSLFVPMDITTQTTLSRNECIAGYFGVSAVALAPK